MSTEQQGYGYTSDEVKQSPFNFGLNAGTARLTKFEWIPNGGAAGAEQQALDIVFTINGTEKGYRQFPITKAFTKENAEVTDPNSPEMKEAFTNFNAIVTHILHCFQTSDVIKAAFGRPVKDFKDFCTIAASVLPQNYKEVPLDIFLQFQWNLKEGTERTFLELPKSMKYGKWLALAQPGPWKENKLENPTDSDREALYYTNTQGIKHPFIRNGWYMTKNFAKQQKAEGATGSSAIETAADAGVSQGPATPATSGSAAAW